jgi:hypothetical protein
MQGSGSDVTVGDAAPSIDHNLPTGMVREVLAWLLLRGMHVLALVICSPPALLLLLSLFHAHPPLATLDAALGFLVRPGQTLLWSSFWLAYTPAYIISTLSFLCSFHFDVVDVSAPLLASSMSSKKVQ